MRLQRDLEDKKFRTYDMGGVLSGWVMGSEMCFRKPLPSAEIAMEQRDLTAEIDNDGV